MTRKEEATYFYKLLKLKNKLLRYDHHLQYLTACENNSLIANGISIRKVPVFTDITIEYKEKWDEILLHSSRQLQKLMIDWIRENIVLITKNIKNLENLIHEQLGYDIFVNINGHVDELVARERLQLVKKRNKKLDILAVEVIEDAEEQTITESELERVYQRMEDFLNNIRKELNNDNENSSNQDNILERDTMSTEGETTVGKNNIQPDNGEFALRTKSSMNIVVNLSKRTLTYAEHAVLSKGLNFCPTPEEIDVFELKKDIMDYIRRIRCKEFFYVDNEVEQDFSQIPRFRNASQWCPEKNREMGIEAYAEALINKLDIGNLNGKRYNRNITKDEQLALEKLRTYDDIIIKEADKGSAVVVMDRDGYILEAQRQLGDVDTYDQLVGDERVLETAKLVNSEVENLRIKGYIDDKTHDFLRAKEDIRAGRFYLLPKINKQSNPGRPVVSCCGTPTERISEFVDYHLQPLVKNVRSYIKDTTDFLKQLQHVGTLPENTIFVTLDVVGLYPNIPHEGGLEAIRRALNTRKNPEVPGEMILQLAKIVLENNVFEFDEKFYIQKQGTAIGTKMAPTYANLFMAMLEEELIAKALLKPFLWLRYIDDVFMIWTHGVDKLNEFIHYLNDSSYTTIKFTSDYSQTNINFLDVMISNEGGRIETDLYVKPTDKHQYLHMTSCHPRGCKKGIPYAQALRLRRICSKNETFQKRCQELRGYLISRGYKDGLIKKQIQQVERIRRKDLLTYKAKKKNKRVPLVVTYHPALPDLNKILRELHPVLHTSNRCRQAVPEVPMVAYRRPKSLKDFLIRARLRSGCVDANFERGVSKCGDKRCGVCSYLKSGESFVSSVTGKKFSINYALHCNSSNVIYLVTCKVCKLQYVGSTTNRFRLRFNNHLSRMRKHESLDRRGKMSDDIIYRHFYSCRHHGLGDMSVQLIDRVNNKDNLISKEGQWAYRLRTISPHGLNEDDFFFSKNTKTRKRK